MGHAAPFLLLLLAARAPAGAAGEWHEVTTLHFGLFHLEGQRPLAVDLAGVAEGHRRKILADLGFAGPDRIRVYICDSLARMRRAAPRGAKVPPWAAGMAFERHDLILLKVDRRTGSEGDLRLVFLHELAHLALGQAVGLRKVPRWFHEGFAIYQSGEWSFGRVTALGSGVLSGRLFSLQALTESFPTSPPDVELAYAQSIDFVAFLLDRYGRRCFHRLIEFLGRGWSFVNAVEEAYDEGIFRIEAQWHADLKMRFTWLPVLTGTATLWFLAALVLMAAWLRKRRARTLALRMMEDFAVDEDDRPPPPLTPYSP